MFLQPTRQRVYGGLGKPTIVVCTLCSFGVQFLLFVWVMSPMIFLVRPAFSKGWPHQKHSNSKNRTPPSKERIIEPSFEHSKNSANTTPSAKAITLLSPKISERTTMPRGKRQKRDSANATPSAKLISPTDALPPPPKHPRCSNCPATAALCTAAALRAAATAADADAATAAAPPPSCRRRCAVALRPPPKHRRCCNRAAATALLQPRCHRRAVPRRRASRCRHHP